MFKLPDRPTHAKRHLGIFRVRCVFCEVQPNTKGKPQVNALLEVVSDIRAGRELFKYYGDLSPRAIRYTMASLRALVHPSKRYELTRVSELAAAAIDTPLAPPFAPLQSEAFASVISEHWNGEDRVRVEYIYPADAAGSVDPRNVNGSPMGARGTAADVARIDLESAPHVIESAESRERMGDDGELEEDASDRIMVSLPIGLVSQMSKTATLRSSRHMRRLAQHIARQVR